MKSLLESWPKIWDRLYLKLEALAKSLNSSVPNLRCNYGHCRTKYIPFMAYASFNNLNADTAEMRENGVDVVIQCQIENDYLSVIAFVAFQNPAQCLAETPNTLILLQLPETEVTRQIEDAMLRIEGFIEQQTDLVARGLLA